jgi:hypothetical protein
MKQSLVIKTHAPIFRKYPGVPKAPEHITAVPMVTYREKDEKRFVLQSEQVRPQYYIRWKMDMPFIKK